MEFNGLPLSTISRVHPSLMSLFTKRRYYRVRDQIHTIFQEEQFEVLTTTVKKSYIFLDTMQRNAFKIGRRFGGTRHHLEDRRKSPAK